VAPRCGLRSELSVMLFQEGETALHKAARGGHYDVVAFLVSKDEWAVNNATRCERSRVNVAK
jgi:hypothetical protein